jgi:hypothetical protein
MMLLDYRSDIRIGEVMRWPVTSDALLLNTLFFIFVLVVGTEMYVVGVAAQAKI